MKIIAYGSLMNQKSLELATKKSKKLFKTTLLGYERIFNAPFGKFNYLNLRRNEKAIIEVAFFNINNDDLKFFEEREKGSKLVEVKPGYFAFIWPADIYTERPVLKSYLQTCENGAKRLKINFWLNTVRPEKTIDDLVRPRYENYCE